jgi:hypothetical protein
VSWLQKWNLKKFFLIVHSPDANWGSSTQSQAFLTALKGVHNLTKVDEHIKNYRPKVIGYFIYSLFIIIIIVIIYFYYLFIYLLFFHDSLFLYWNRAFAKF